MRRIGIGLLALGLGSCTTAQQAMFQADVVQFNNDVTAVNSAIATVSVALAQNCSAIVTTGQALAVLVGTSKAAGAGIVGLDAALQSYCQAAPTNIPQAVQATTAAISAGKAAQASAKAGN